jgi:hypothetical protein
LFTAAAVSATTTNIETGLSTPLIWKNNGDTLPTSFFESLPQIPDGPPYSYYLVILNLVELLVIFVYQLAAYKRKIPRLYYYQYSYNTMILDKLTS